MSNIMKKDDKKLEQVEKETFLLFYKDGVIDLAMSSWLIIFAVNKIVDFYGIESPYIIRILIVPISIALALFKQFVTQPRIGFVRFGIRRRIKMLIIYIGLLVIFSLGLFIWLAISLGFIRNDIDRFVSLSIEIIVLLVIFIALGILTGYSKYIILGVFFVISSPVTLIISKYLEFEFYGIVIAFIGGIYFLVEGTTAMIKFFKTYRKKPVEFDGGK